MVVRAKFYVEQKTETKDGCSIKLRPVVDGSPENKEFFKWTPGGLFDLQTINLAAAEQFKPGNNYFIDISPAE